jgi:uncharacterized protein (UPF0335 family)
MTDQAENPRAVAGDNSSFRVAADELRSYLDRIERLEDEKSGHRRTREGVFAEAKGKGYDVKAMRAILRMRKRDQSEVEQEIAILQTYGRPSDWGCSDDEPLRLSARADRRGALPLLHLRHGRAA